MPPSPRLEAPIEIEARIFFGYAQDYFEVKTIAHKLVKEGRLANAPSFFETVTAVSFLAFAEAKSEVAVLEVGMGEGSMRPISLTQAYPSSPTFRSITQSGLE